MKMLLHSLLACSKCRPRTVGVFAVLAGSAAVFMLSGMIRIHTANSDLGAPEDTVIRTHSPSVQTVRPQRRTLTRKLTIPGNVAPWYQATLYAKVPGYLKWIGFDKGDEVKQGQLLAVIDAPEIEEQYQQASAEFAIKDLTYRRLHNVWKVDPDVIAKQDVDTAQAAADAARHVRDSRRTYLGYTKVAAPFAGTITARFADPGALIQAATGSASQATPLFTVMDLERVRVYASVPQESASFVRPGTKVILTDGDRPATAIETEVTRTTEVLDPTTRTLLIEIDVPNPQHLLQPGRYLHVTLYLREINGALAVPPAAINSSPAGRPATVFVVDEGTVKVVPIKTGIDDGRWIEVVEGLAGDEDIIVTGKLGLAHGQAVVASKYDLPEGKFSSQRF
jgi:RND family efflux transporter MFP subunit